MSGDIKKQRDRWRKETHDPEASKKPGRKSTFETLSQIPLEPLYSPADIDPGAYLAKSGFPGEFPYTRGVYPTMYRGRPWTIRQYAGFGTAEETNVRFRYLLEQGQKGLSVAFDLPTQMGYDSDSPMARGEVGKVGVAIDTIDDLRTLFDQISLEKISTSMTINATAAVLLAMYVAIGEEQGLDRSILSGTIQNDILKEYIARGTYIFPPGPSMRLTTDTFAWCAENLPNWNPISISGYHIREAGSTAVQEIAFTLADAITYVESGVAAGLDVDAFAPRLSFFFNVHNNFLEEVAKFRAARRLWAHIIKNRFGAKKPGSMRLRFHTQTAGCTLTAQQPENNVIRVTIQALAAVLGGTQSLHTNSLDEAIGLPSDEAVRTALRTQQVILEESGVADSIDPLGGSYLVESLTDQIEERARALITSIDEMGGMVKAIEAGFPQQEIERSSYEYQKAVENQELKVIGINVYADPNEKTKEPFKLDPVLEQAQVKKLHDYKAVRDEAAVQKCRSSLEESAAGDNNLFPVILDSVKAGVTIGEICESLAKIFGRYNKEK